MRSTSKKVGVSMMMLATLLWGYMGVSSRVLNQISLRSVDIFYKSPICCNYAYNFFIFHK